MCSLQLRNLALLLKTLKSAFKGYSGYIWLQLQSYSRIKKYMRVYISIKGLKTSVTLDRP